MTSPAVCSVRRAGVLRGSHGGCSEGSGAPAEGQEGDKEKQRRGAVGVVRRGGAAAGAVVGAAAAEFSGGADEEAVGGGIEAAVAVRVADVGGVDVADAGDVVFVEGSLAGLSGAGEGVHGGLLPGVGVADEAVVGAGVVESEEVADLVGEGVLEVDDVSAGERVLDDAHVEVRGVDLDVGVEDLAGADDVGDAGEGDDGRRVACAPLILAEEDDVGVAAAGAAGVVADAVLVGEAAGDEAEPRAGDVVPGGEGAVDLFVGGLGAECLESVLVDVVADAGCVPVEREGLFAVAAGEGSAGLAGGSAGHGADEGVRMGGEEHEQGGCERGREVAWGGRAEDAHGVSGPGGVGRGWSACGAVGGTSWGAGELSLGACGGSLSPDGG